MAAPKVLVLRAPGINCERECYHAFEMAGGAPEWVHVKKLVAKPELLDQFQILMVPGGFAYGDVEAVPEYLDDHEQRLHVLDLGEMFHLR